MDIIDGMSKEELVFLAQLINVRLKEIYNTEVRELQGKIKKLEQEVMYG